MDAADERGQMYNGKTYCHKQGYGYTANRIASEYERRQWMNEGTSMMANRIVTNKGTKDDASVHW